MIRLPEQSLAWAVLALGFALLAGGVPLSSFALFTSMAAVSATSGFPWWAAGTMAGLATALGHWGVHTVFALLGPRFPRSILERWPSFVPSVSAVRRILVGRGAWQHLLLLRWVGLGYSQAFWLLGAAGAASRSLLVGLLVNDLIWAMVWAYGTNALALAVPALTRQLTYGALFLMAATMLMAFWRLRARPRI